jgi:hypothetical protein
MRTPYESNPDQHIFQRKILKAGLSPLVVEGFTAAAWQRFVAPQRSVLFIGAWWPRGSEPAVPPKSEKPAGRYHVSPKSAKRSINFCKNPVKRKTLNIVGVFVPRLLVVVMFHACIRLFLRHFHPSRAVH